MPRIGQFGPKIRPGQKPLVAEKQPDGSLKIADPDTRAVLAKTEQTTRGRRQLGKLLWGKMKRIPATIPKDGSNNDIPLSTDHTSQAQFTLECPTDQPQIVLFNTTGYDLVNVRATLTVQTASGAIDGVEANGNFENCIQLTYKGATTFTLPGTIDGVACSAENPHMFVLDLVQDWKLVSKDRTDFPGRLPLYCLRVHLPAAGNYARPSFDLPPGVSGWGTERMDAAPYGRVVRLRTQNVLAASLASQGNFNATAWDNNVFPFAVLYTPRGREGAFAILYGNSIDEGALSTVSNFGWMHEVQNLISTQQRPFELFCFAASGTGSSLERHRSKWIEVVQPTLVLWPCWNHNDFRNNSPIVQEDLDYNRFRNAPLLARSSQSNTKLLPVSSTPVTYSTSLKTYGVTDALRLANDELFKGLYPEFIDVASPLNGAVVNGQIGLKVEYLPPNGADAAPGLHPAGGGPLAMARSAAPMIMTVLGWK